MARRAVTILQKIYRKPVSASLPVRLLPIPADDPSRQLAIVDPDDPQLQHIAVVGDTYTVLLSGAQTNGRYCLIDMAVPQCGGPGPHRHDFEEMFHLLEAHERGRCGGRKQRRGPRGGSSNGVLTQDSIL